MIIVLKPGWTERDIRTVEEKIRANGLTAHISKGVERTIIGAIGDERKLDADAFEGMLCVEKVVRRDFRKEDTVITVMGQKIGGGTIAVVAGPCSVEGRDMMVEIGGRVAA